MHEAEIDHVVEHSFAHHSAILLIRWHPTNSVLRTYIVDSIQILVVKRVLHSSEPCEGIPLALFLVYLNGRFHVNDVCSRREGIVSFPHGLYK